MSYPLTERLAEFAAAVRFDDLPEEALDAVRLGFTDCVACLLAGSTSPHSTMLLRAVAPRDAHPGARLLLGRRRVLVEDAALVNGATAHALDMDDVALRGSHPSAVLVPAIVAQAEELGSSGRDMMTAYAVGFEVWARIVERERDSYLPKGWHMTAVIGPVAAAAALANLRRLSSVETRNAMAIAASCSAGTVAGWTGTKPFQVGRAAQSGVVAAKLAAGGICGSPIALEGRNGLLVALSPKGDLDLETPCEDLFDTWRLTTQGLHVKVFPFILGTHRALDGILDLVQRHDIAPDKVARITLNLGPAQAAFRQMSDGLGSFNATWMWLAAASAVIVRRATLAELRPEFHNRADVRRFQSILEVRDRADISPDHEPNLGYSRMVTLHLTDGRELTSEPADFYPGHWTRRLSRAQLQAKFDYLAGDAALDLGLGDLFDRLQRLETLASVASLLDPR